MSDLPSQKPPDPVTPAEENDEDYEPTPYKAAVASYCGPSLPVEGSLQTPSAPTDPLIIHPNIREAIEADSNVGALINTMPSSYDPVIKFHTVVGTLFPLWLQIEKYAVPLILDQA